MAATGSDQDLVVGRTNHADGHTALWAKVPPGKSNFWGGAILYVRVAKHATEDDEDEYESPATFVPSNPFHGIIATGHSGSGPSNFGGTPGFSGVIGRGGANQGTGVVGLGGGGPPPEPEVGSRGAGGIGVHGLGGSESDFFANFGGSPTDPGAGVIGQGGRQHDNGNTLRLPHAAGVIAIGGGIGGNRDFLSAHTLMQTGGVGVYAQGAEQTLSMVAPAPETPPGPNVPSGPLEPGAGVLGRGGVTMAPRPAPHAAGVIGLAGGVPIPNISETANTGVYGAGATGVFGHGPIGVRGQGDGGGPGVHGVSLDAGRGGMFESARSAQVQLVPQGLRASFPPAVAATPTSFPGGNEGVQLPKDGRGGDLLALMDDQRQCALWFCIRAEDGSDAAQWAQVLLGPSFPGRA